jgi:hypothetical protein
MGSPLFPKHACYYQTRARSKTAYPEHDNPPRHTAELRVYSDTSLATISSLLRFPLEWEFVDGQTTRNPVLGITSTYVSFPAVLSLGEPDRRGFFTPISAGIRRIVFCRREEDEGQQGGQGGQERRETSIRTLSQFSSPDFPPEDKTIGKNQLDLQCDEPAAAKAWLREVRRSFIP